MRTLFLIYLVVIVLAATGDAQTSEPEYRDSIHLSCLESPFLSVSAHTPRHDGFPDVEIRLTNPQGRSAGNGPHDNQIPKSQYGKVAEMPKRPNISKAVAVEVCDAIAGRYVIRVTEHGSAEYRITVRGGGDKVDTNAQILYLRPDGERTCEYRFYFLIAEGKAAIRWLDNGDHPLEFLRHPECGPVPRA
jgi:hypothetical protein